MRDMDRVRERVRQLRAEVTRTHSGAPAAPPCAEGRLGCQFRAGDMVFDRETGAVGEVIGATRETIIVPATERHDG